MDIFLNAVKDFGFPVACVIALFWMLQKEQESHKQETAALTQAISDLRMVMTKILVKLGVDDDGK